MADAETGTTRKQGRELNLLIGADRDVRRPYFSDAPRLAGGAVGWLAAGAGGFTSPAASSPAAARNVTFCPDTAAAATGETIGRRHVVLVEYTPRGG